MLLRLPGVYRPQTDSFLLAQALSAETVGARTRILDLCAGTGVLTTHAAAAGAKDITAVDIGRRAVVNTRINAWLKRAPVRVLRGDLTAPVDGERFDLVVSNPPYVPSETDRLPTRGPARAWDAGSNGRSLLDRICTDVPDVLADGGVLLLLQSALCGLGKTQVMLEEQGLEVEIVRSLHIPFGPITTAREGMLRRRGLVEEGQDRERVVVFRAARREVAGRG
ncbi:class I SAM-dependent methyltransferase [Prescottella defluvii]|uniref:HemK2/MTQ2 family protein methyltransferase n=1 Tax=Prescottella defluvii TaxID=1323361 RepID=UPI0004F29C08|nr:HemK2/MTQ2 family protein methyltransferase [Prescottella defluvii]